MGIWGVKIDQSDTFAEVCESFKEAISSGLLAQSAYDQILNEYSDSPEYHIAVLALTDCLWHCNRLESKHVDFANQVANVLIDNRYWKECGATKELLQRRECIVKLFFQKIKDPPPNDELWILCPKPPKHKKGTVFWYRISGRIFGAIILDIQLDGKYFFIALSDEFKTYPSSIQEILSKSLYTAAWFCETNVLPFNRIHPIGYIQNNFDYNGFAGFLYQEKQFLRCKNCGNSMTWKHTYRFFYKPSSKVQDTLRPSFFYKERLG